MASGESRSGYRSEDMSEGSSLEPVFAEYLLCALLGAGSQSLLLEPSTGWGCTLGTPELGRYREGSRRLSRRRPRCDWQLRG